MAGFEERMSLALTSSFGSNRRHRRLIGHKARTFDFQVTSMNFNQLGRTNLVILHCPLCFDPRGSLPKFMFFHLR